MFLLDTMIISDLAKKNSNPGVSAWLAGQKLEELFISVITLGEIRRGIVMQENKNPVFAMRLQEWFDTLQDTYGDRILPISREVALLWGEVSAKIGNAESDILIAATALHYDLTVVTRNVRHFEKTGVSCLNPWLE